LPKPENSESSGVRLSIVWTNKNYMRPESQAESLEDRGVVLLKDAPLSKSDLAEKLGKILLPS
jgi:hypothetical protein